MSQIETIRQEILSQDLKPEFKEELLNILEEEKERIEGIIYRFNNSQAEEELFEERRKFPTFDDIGSEVKKFDDHKDLGLMIVTAFYMEEEIEKFYEDVQEDAENILQFMDGEENHRGEKLYHELINGREYRSSENELREKLRKYLEDYEKEFQNYEDESEAYEDREVNEEGLLLTDAVKCLEDFEGRTFPFLRGICDQISEGDSVVEPGAGTGIMMIAAELSGAEEIVGLEINPLTCILAKNIFDDLSEKGLVKRYSLDILWNDVLKFATEEHRRYFDETFDAVITENIYTGMFFELQMEMVKHILRTGLVETEKEMIKGVEKISSKAPVIPSAMSSGLQLAEVSGEWNEPMEVRLDFEDRGGEVEALSKDHIYDQIDFSVVEEGDILSVMRFHVTEGGELNALLNYSTVRIKELDYIGRNENDFLNNDSIFFLNEPIQVEEGDQVIVGLAFNQSVAAKDLIIEVRKVREYGEPEAYDARLDVSERKQEINKSKFKTRNDVRQDLDLKNIGDFEVLRSSSFHDGYERPWMTDIDYKNREGYGV
jgi:hypothetical protein